MPPFVTIIIDIAAFGLVAALAIGLFRRFELGVDVRRRIRGESTAGAAVSATPLVRREDVRNPILAWVQRSLLNDPKDRQELRAALTAAGWESPTAPAIYVTIRFSLAIGLPFLFLFSQTLVSHPMGGLKLIVIAIFLCGAAMMLPRAYINARASGRRTQLEHEFPDALDLMVVCVEAGLALEAAFIRVGDETAESHPRISAEFRNVSQELRAGRTRAEALRSMGDRTQVDVVKSFVALLIQTDALGVSIAQSLRTYAAEMRQHRMLKAEEKAMRIPVLLTIPLVGAILPVIVTAALLPAIIDTIRVIGPAMNHVASAPK